MKQVLIVSNDIPGGATPKNLTALIGTVNCAGVYDFDDDTQFLTEAPTKDFALVHCDGINVPRVFEVDYDTLTVVKGVPQQATPAAAKIQFTVPAGEPGKTYTIMVLRHGGNPRERNVWRISVTTTGPETGAQLRALLVKQINEFVKGNSIDKITVVEGSGTLLSLEVLGDAKPDFTFELTDGLYGLAETDIVINTLTLKQLENMLSEGAENKGFEYTYEDGPTVYPAYPEKLNSSADYVVYTLRFATRRINGVTHDERVWQVINLVVEDGNAPDLQAILEDIKVPSDNT